MEQNLAFLGRGWAFPPSFVNELKGVEMISNEQDIEQSLAILLSTRLGERVMVPEYGCDLQELLFSPLNLTLKTFVADLVKTSILYFEPRIDVEKVDISSGDDLAGELLVEIDYRVRATNSRKNMVYPFYKEEGTEL